MINAQPLPQLKNCAPLPKLKNTIDYMQTPRTKIDKFGDMFDSNGDDAFEIAIFDFEGLSHSTKLPLSDRARAEIEDIIYPDMDPVESLRPVEWSFALRKMDNTKFKVNLVNQFTSKQFYIANVE